MSVSSRSGVWPRTAVMAAVVCLGLAGARGAAAQTRAPIFSLDQLKIGDCKVVVKIENPRSGDDVGVVVDQTRIREQTVGAGGGGTLTFGLIDPLRPGSIVVVRVNGVDALGKDGKPLRLQLGTDAKSGAVDPCKREAELGDESPFDAGAFFGTVVDNFAPDNVGAYINPEAGSTQKTQWIFGFNFDYRLLGRSDSPVQVWLEGETMHGVRTADVDCAPPDPADKPPVCGDATPQNALTKAKYILENADSLEAWVSPRVEFMTLQFGTDTPAQIYGTVSFGFVALKDAPKVFRTHHVGAGFLTKEGPFEDSYLEAGWGKNELLSDRWNRFKVSGALSFNLDALLPVWKGIGRVFAEMALDNDFGEGADSIRTFFGIDIDLKGLSQ